MILNNYYIIINNFLIKISSINVSGFPNTIGFFPVAVIKGEIVEPPPFYYYYYKSIIFK